MRPLHRQPDHGTLARLGVRFSASVPITSQMVAEGSNMQQLGAPSEAPPTGVGYAMPASRQHATNIHMALWMLGAFGVIAAFHLGGWRMAFDVGMGR
ncbi:MAG TPA: hypothetical protein VMP89_05980 [Solirubrobacteraceae bacterium]|nr:hypothetical protein [Solirubrobacteraceae bacterium]